MGTEISWIFVSTPPRYTTKASSVVEVLSQGLQHRPHAFDRGLATFHSQMLRRGEGLLC